MGLAGTISNAVQSAFAALGDVMTSAQVESVASITVNTSSDVATVTSSRTVISSALFSAYRISEIDGEQVQQHDIKLMLSQASFTGPPTASDKVHRLLSGASVVYNVLDYGEDPAHATWVLQLRRSS